MFNRRRRAAADRVSLVVLRTEAPQTHIRMLGLSQDLMIDRISRFMVRDSKMMREGSELYSQGTSFEYMI